MESPNITDIVYGHELPQLDDPAETWFEASKFARPTVWWDSMGVFLLESSPWLQEASTRAGKRFDHRPAIDLASRTPLNMDVDTVLARRRSTDDHDADAHMTQSDLAALLHAAYGTNGSCAPGHPGRTVPSGGGLFPLELYVAVSRVEGIEPGIYHVDPSRMRLERLTDGSVADVAATTIQPETVETASIVVLIGVSFWRSRFKYGQRALRFALLEAGHVAQNLLVGGDRPRPVAPPDRWLLRR
jgi:SagB-type dehydrogenase family enzyme